MKKDQIYLITLSIVIGDLVVLFNFLPRSTYSPLEKRDLKEFPTFSLKALKSGEFTKNINIWFSDSEPYRDLFMTASMKQKNLLSVSIPGQEQVKFHAATPTKKPSNGSMEAEGDDREIGEYKNNIAANENAKIANKGIVVVGSGENVRALMAFGGGTKGGVEYAQAANQYKKTFGANVNVYCMVIPTAIEFYCPVQAKSSTNSQRATISNIFHHLDKDVKAVNVYTPLGKHAAEPIYLRTDHHWAPLGAFYAAQEFARIAKVPFKSLANYERRVVHRFVGTMYGYAKDISIKNAPEDFVYYVPKNLDYTTEYQDYKLSHDYQIQGKPTYRKGTFFVHYPDGHGGAYCTFMGGDARIATITTPVKNNRRLLIIKDSFGNAFSSFLFFSFNQICIVDIRYFDKNMKTFVKEHKITDILFASNIFNAYQPKIANKITTFLTQEDAKYE